MGEIRISIPGESLGFPYPVCKKRFSAVFTSADKSYLTYHYPTRRIDKKRKSNAGDQKICKKKIDRLIVMPKDDPRTDFSIRI